MATSLEAGLRRDIEGDVALHYLNDPRHGHAVLKVLAGLCAKVEKKLSDDPVLAAYQLRDILPEIYGHAHDLNQWAYAVIEAPPDAVPESGARL